MDEREERCGGGSGGGDASNHVANVGGAYAIQANQVELLSRPPDLPLLPTPCVISIVSTSELPGDGRVEVRGDQGVRITTGPLGVPAASSDSTCPRRRASRSSTACCRMLIRK